MKRVVSTLMFVHRYLGLAFCLIFVAWFASGIVMIYKRMPEYSADERLSRLPPLDASTIKLSAAEAMAAADVLESPRRVLLTSLQARPLYRFIVDGGTASVYADDGSYLEGVEPDVAVAVVRGLFPDARATVRYVDSLESADQWTINNRFDATGRLHRVSLGDAAGTEVYVAEATGEVVQKTDRSSRFWGYAGPVMHWFYFTPLRAERGPLWNDLIVYGSVVGCLVCMLGLVIGVYRFSASRRFKRGTSATPYVGWLRWHHYAGLVFGVVTLTWTFSGLLTMTPFGWFDQGGPTLDQARAIRGTGVAVERFVVTPRAALEQFGTRFQAKEMEFLQFLDAPFYAAYEGADPSARPHQDTARFAPPRGSSARVLLTADRGPEVKDGFTRDELAVAARAAMGGMEPVELTWLTEMDAYYYERTNGVRLPALRAKFDDVDGTWLYLDANDGSLVQTEVRDSRAERWLYQGLHSLDFPWIYQTPWLWYPLILVLMLGGLALSLTSAIVGWRFLRGRTRPAAASAEPIPFSRSA
jgi:hypothetical protein